MIEKKMKIEIEFYGISIHRNVCQLMRPLIAFTFKQYWLIAKRNDIKEKNTFSDIES